MGGFVHVYLQFNFLYCLMGLQLIFWEFEGVEIRGLLSPLLFLVMMEVFSKMIKRVEGASLLRGFKADGRRGGGVCVSHLLFADDTILFCDANEE